MNIKEYKEAKRKLKIKYAFGVLWAIIISALIYAGNWILGIILLIIFNRIYTIKNS